MGRAVGEPSRSPTVAARMVRWPVLRLVSTGLPAAELLSALGLEPAALVAAGTRLPATSLTAAWTECERLSGDAAFGVHACEDVDLRGLVVNDFADYLPMKGMAFCDDVAESLHTYCRYWKTSHDAAGFSFERDAEAGRVRLCSDEDPERAAPWVEPSLLIVVKALRDLPGRAVRVEALRFRHRRRASAGELERAAGVAPSFEAPANELVIGGAALQVPLAMANRARHAELEREFQAELARLADRRPFRDEVREVLLRSLGRGEPTARETARQLSISERTLMRRLLDEGTRHQELLDQVRAERARKLLDEGRKHLDVAAQLGYSDARSFQRAFKRWFGTTPGRARRAS